MISPDVLFELVPSRDPEDDFPLDPQVFDIDPNSPGRRIGVWAAYLRHRIYQDMTEDRRLRGLIDTSGFLATGVFRVPNGSETDDDSEFRTISGYQFGAMLLRSASDPETDGTYLSSISLDSGRHNVPLIQTLANFNPHTTYSQGGYAAAVFEDDNGSDCGITAAHVVANHRRGRRVPVLCSACGNAAVLKKKAPGFIDAAIVEFPCGGPYGGKRHALQTVRSAVEGETVEAHFGDTGKKECTVMMSLSTASQIKCAATPKHFLIDSHGHPGDSGSLISAERSRRKKPDLIGMYLGDTDCEDENQNYVTYGYALDLKQAADLLGASNLKGEFNV